MLIILSARRGAHLLLDVRARKGRDIHCEEHGHIRVKGIAYPVAISTNLDGIWDNVGKDD